MADEVRRSGRANKGHHTKNQDALDEPVPKSKPKGKPEKKAQPQTPAPQQTTPAPQSRAQSAQSAQSTEPPEDDEAIYRCVCGEQREIRGREMICCDRCEAWQHNKCLNLPGSEFWEDKTYLCEQCNPDAHAELLAAMARGEKPWNRKKGSKAAKPKFRHSDIGTDASADNKETTPSQATPTAGGHAQDTPSATPAAGTPTPSQTRSETAKESTNGNAEAKAHGKKATQKAHPQSPLGEKRPHDAVAEKETESAKRRKSSGTHHEKSVPETAMATDPAQLPEKQKLLVEKLITLLSSLVKEASDSRGFRIPDGATPTSIATRLALQIDHASITYHGVPTDNSSPYSQHFRSILFNIKKNTILLDRLLSGSLKPDELGSMSTEEMASEEKQKEFAVMREAAEKQMVLTEETGPRLRKTHKGEEIVGEDTPGNEPGFRPPERIRDGADGEHRSPKQEDGNVVELPEDLGRGPLAVDTSSPRRDSVRRPSTNFDINSVFDKVKSPQADQQHFIQRRQSSIRAQQTSQQGPGDDADIDRLLKDEDNDTEMTGYAADPTIVWHGTLDMQSVGPFDAVARFVAGGDFGLVVPWDRLLTSKLPIAGRIESQRGNDYIQGLSSSGSHDVGVLAVHPVTPEGRTIYDHLYNYFQPRDRWGVVPVERLNNEAMRDLYVIPVEPGGGELPRFLNMLEYCTIETPRREPMLLLALVAKLPEDKAQAASGQPLGSYSAAHSTPSQFPHAAPPVPGSMGGPSPSPVNPNGPQYSPVQPGFPPSQSFGAPPAPMHHQNGFPHPGMIPQVPIHHRNPRAVEIFGPHIDAPVIVQILTHFPDMSELQMNNLRHIVDNVPAARTDINLLNEHMRQRNEGAPQQA
ncbi:SPOC-domain-containing protein [Aaosphaeria arxii CBS 175.79]|uniref:Transcription factor BYE1 n=1 Tax=Aaosphaeria arxii CBS 175.79 TaxID=1450172 RepID=A0A6A5X9I9_9PLEO|nr:SPOC-domain-containing protein [Aaosphaeria arxii CBS 175.79]KAF2009621.1 SPOC-domain-containing protein [Aaosphaeria arxii CBS 175.79]